MKKRVNRWLWRAESSLDALVLSARKRLDPVADLRIQAYWGYGTPSRVKLLVRVLADLGIQPATARDSLRDNLRAALKQIATREIPGVSLQAELLGQKSIALTDEEGYARFEFSMSPLSPGAAPWHPVRVFSREALGSPPRIVSALTQVLIPPPHAGWGIISDVDDTIIYTGAASALQKTRVTLLRNAHSRVPFKGAAAFYKALQAGPEGSGFNPLFYLSSSPWNLFDLLAQFLEVHGFPQGPLILRDLGLEEMRFFQSTHLEHKLCHARLLMEDWPDLPFILIGDSGQHDPEIYLELARASPSRVLAVYIRNVSDLARQREVMGLAEEAAGLGVTMLLVKDSLQAALHAREKGWIAAEALPAIGEQKLEDELT